MNQQSILRRARTGCALALAAALAAGAAHGAAINPWGQVLGVRIYVGYVPAAGAAATGTLTVTHGFDGKTFKKVIPVKQIDAGPVTYTVPGGAKVNEFIRMEVK